MSKITVFESQALPIQLKKEKEKIGFGKERVNTPYFNLSIRMQERVCWNYFATPALNLESLL